MTYKTNNVTVTPTKTHSSALYPINSIIYGTIRGITVEPTFPPKIIALVIFPDVSMPICLSGSATTLGPCGASAQPSNIIPIHKKVKLFENIRANMTEIIVNNELIMRIFHNFSNVATGMDISLPKHRAK